MKISFHWNSLIYYVSKITGEEIAETYSRKVNEAEALCIHGGWVCQSSLAHLYPIAPVIRHQLPWRFSFCHHRVIH